MQPQSAQDYKQLLTEVIKKQIVILGPDITLSKARNVKGLIVGNDGTVTGVEGSPQEVTQALIDQFVQLSGLIVKKTMEPLLLATQQPFSSQVPQAAPDITIQPPLQTVPQQPAPQPTVPAVQPVPQPAGQNTPLEAPAGSPLGGSFQQPVNQPLPAPQQPVSSPTQSSDTVPAPAANPLAA